MCIMEMCQKGREYQSQVVWSKSLDLYNEELLLILNIPIRQKTKKERVRMRERTVNCSSIRTSNHQLGGKNSCEKETHRPYRCGSS
jgi:hypothetical protein